MTTVDIAWTAGFLEGEGSFIFNKGSVNVVATQVQCQPLQVLQKLCGGALYDYEIRNNKRANPAWRWCLSGPMAVGLMMTIFQFMSPKRKGQINKALGVWRAAPVAFKYRTHCPQGHPYDQANTYRDIRRGARQCRACNRIREALRRAASRI